MFHPRGEAVTAFLDQLIADRNAVVDRLTAEYELGETQGIIRFSLDYQYLVGLAHRADRPNLASVAMILALPAVSFSLRPSVLRSSESRQHRARYFAIWELRRAVMIVGLLDVLSAYDTDRYFVDLRRKAGLEIS